MFGLTTTRRHRAELAAAKAETDRLRRQLTDARTERSAFRTAATVASRRFSEADAAARRMAGRNLELGRRISALTEADPEYTARLERRVRRLLTVAARLFLAHREEKARADHLQARLDDVFGLNTSPVTNGAAWQDRREQKMRYDK